MTGPRIIFVEGIPGTGKTTTAERAAAWLRDRGIVATWHDELVRPHPVVPRPLMKRWREPGYGALCAESLARFVAALPEDAIEILESTLFQQTARFLWAADRGDEVPAYLAGVAAATVSAEPALLHLRPDDRPRHCRQFTVPHRGPEWTAKLAAYVEGTALGQRHGWHGLDGLVAFWAAYGEACDAWCKALPFARAQIAPDPDDWPALDAAVREWLARAFEPRAPGASAWSP